MKTIVIGYGNIDRADDGVAFAVINELRRRLGRPALEEGDTGLENLGGEVDSIFLLQLVPEIMELITGYEQVVFVDAHVGPDMEDLNCAPVDAEYTPSSFTHHMTPSSLMAFLKTLYGSEPRAYLVSIGGSDFDFTRELSPKTRSLVAPAADKILGLLG
jgi:hydrogenase maturation protease